MFCAKKRPDGVAVTDFGEMFPVTESIRASSRSASGIVVVVVVVVVVGAAVVVGATVVVGAAVVVGASVVVGATVVTGAATTSSAWLLNVQPRAPKTTRAMMSPK
jgi:hypothetical protein